jgi:predicted DNA-binding protein YlxM (UPF0122 family)
MTADDKQERFRKKYEKRVKELHEKNKTPNEIADVLGLNHKTIRKILERLGIKRGYSEAQKLRFVNKRGVGYVHISKRDLKKLYVDEQKTACEIGKIYNITKTAVLSKLRECGVEVRKVGSKVNFSGKNHPRYIDIPKDTLYELYAKEKLSITEIAKKFNTSHRTVLRRMKEHGIKARTTGEALKIRGSVKGKNNPRFGVQSSFMKDRWKDPKYKEKVIKKTLKAATKKPNKQEQKLMDLIQHNNLPFKYVGDGRVIIGGRCPDFIETNGKKQVIELFGIYWHSPLYGKRIPYRATYEGTMEHYKKHRFKCLIIWDWELEKISHEVIVDKIKKFQEGHLKSK